MPDSLPDARSYCFRAALSPELKKIDSVSCPGPECKKQAQKVFLLLTNRFSSDIISQRTGTEDRFGRVCADIAQSVERVLGKDEVSGSNPDISSISTRIPRCASGTPGCFCQHVFVRVFLLSVLPVGLVCRSFLSVLPVGLSCQSCNQEKNE